MMNYKQYSIKSPSGMTLRVSADSIYHAIQIAIGLDDYKYELKEYFNLNPIKTNRRKSK